MKKPDLSGVFDKSKNIGSLILVIFLLCTLFIAPAEAQPSQEQKVLFLNSYNPGMVFSDEEFRGVKESLAPLGEDLDLMIEYMDTKRVSDEEHMNNLRDLYKHKYENAGIDVIVSADNSAFEFLIDHRDEIFPGVPVVFCGLNYFSDEMIEDVWGFTGVVEDKDIRSTLDLAFSQFPDTEYVYVIHDTTNTGQALQKHIEQFLPEYEGRAEFIFVSDVTTPELIDTVSNLPLNSIILLEAFNRDADGIVYTHEEIGDLISGYTDRPMYGNTEMYVGHGVIGGKITAGYQQGMLAGEMAFRILNGESVSSIPVVKNSPNVYIFDYERLSKHSIPESDLPEGSIIINKPDPDQVPVWVFYIASVIIICLVAIVLILFQNLEVRRRIESDLRKNISEREIAQAELKKKNNELNSAYEQMSANEEELRQNYEELIKAENDLRESQRKFQAIFDQTFELAGLLDVDGNVLKANQTALGLIGLSDRDIIGMPFWETPWWSHSTEVQEQIRDGVRTAANGKFVRFETTLSSSETGILHIDFSLKPVADEHGRIVMLIPEARDITDRRMAEDALKQALKKLNLLNSVTFNDIQNNLFSLLGYIELQKDLKDSETAGEFTDKEKQLTLKITESLEFARNYQDLGIKEPIWQDILQIYLFASSHLNTSGFSRDIEIDGLEIYADPMLEKVFVKLIDNTIKHGEGANEIRMYYEEKEDGLNLIYEDNGIGVPVHLKQEIFRRGFGEKKGMGLFLASEILGITGITLAETGEYGRGARFEIFVPKGGYRFVTDEK